MNVAVLASSSTVTQDVYQRLRADLLACRLPPGQKLKIDDLCQQLCAGSSAVREALSRLASEGFVVVEPQRGFRVAPLSFDELSDLTNTRCKVEEICLREAVANASLEWEGDLISALHRLCNTPMRADGDAKRYSDKFALIHTAFHEALVAACPSPWLLRIRQTLYVQQERYRWLSLPLARFERDLNAEHRAIANAALARNADAAVTLLIEHLQTTAQILLSSPTR